MGDKSLTLGKESMPIYNHSIVDVFIRTANVGGGDATFLEVFIFLVLMLM
jgi:hypothetical protein